MHKWLGIILVLGIIGLGGWYLYTSSLPNIKDGWKDALVDQAITLAKDQQINLDGSALGKNPDNPLEDVVGLAIKGINLFQGDKGVELWRLKASFANMSKDGEEITVQNPHVRYQLDNVENQPSELIVEAKHGKITDNQRFLILWDDVTVTHGQDIIKGSKLEYDSKTRIMTFPQGATLTSPDAMGQSQKFSWDLAQNIMQATDQVEVIIKAKTNS